MRSTVRPVLAAGLVAAGFALAGCDSSAANEAEGPASATSTLTETGLQIAVPSGYDPCVDIPQSVLDSEDLVKGVADNKADATGPGGTEWRGCAWARAGGDGYAVSVQVTNVTIPFVREHYSIDRREFTVAGRPAISVRKNETRSSEVCSINIEMRGGSLEFHLDNPASNRDTGQMDTCQLGVTFAEKVVPTLPSNV
ncbi:DUF3558 domain-containing protein [Nocardia sp. NPDC019395]|uniref:DUF3558 domain-containing protein n=1 Tax=Nocardia sp. NPDC019395 TaxID=3154686 RepID=UPI00340C86CA